MTEKALEKKVAKYLFGYSDSPRPWDDCPCQDLWETEARKIIKMVRRFSK